jgi:hypothetical protein
LFGGFDFYVRWKAFAHLLLNKQNEGLMHHFDADAGYTFHLTYC